MIHGQPNAMPVGMKGKGDKVLERIADHAANIARVALDLDLLAHLEPRTRIFHAIAAKLGVSTAIVAALANSGYYDIRLATNSPAAMSRSMPATASAPTFWRCSTKAACCRQPTT